MIDHKKYASLSPADYANFLDREQIMDFGIKELWPQTPRIAGEAFTVQLAAGDHLMLHAAIYEATENSIIVADGVDNNFAVAGGNVCAIAQRRGITAFVIDGVIRDLAEIRENKFPVFARGILPIAGKKKTVTPLNTPITCGGVRVNPGDLIVADEEGIVAVPKDQMDSVFEKAKERADKEAITSLDDWQATHHKKVQEILNKKS